MRFLKRFLLWVTVFAILFFITASVYVKTYGKSLLEQALNESLKCNVVLGNVSYHFPFGIQADNVRIAHSIEGKKILKIKNVVAQLSRDALYERRLAFDSVVFIEPLLIVEQTKQLETDAAGQARRYGVVVPSVEPASVTGDEGSVVNTIRDHKDKARITIVRLMVRQGRIHYVNRLTEKGISFNLEDVQLKAGRLAFPVEPSPCKFHLSARLVKEGNPLSGSHVKSTGWVDVVKKDMETTVEVVEADGTVGMTAHAVSQNNEMDVSGEIKMQKFFLGVKDKASAEASTVNDLVLNALSSAGVEIGAKFFFKTKMDDFQLGQISFSGNAVVK